jgi:hypothetical protein
MLSIRRADGEEVVSIVATGDEWSVHLQPGGAGTKSQAPRLGIRTVVPAGRGSNPSMRTNARAHSRLLGNGRLGHDRGIRYSW